MYDVFSSSKRISERINAVNSLLGNTFAVQNLGKLHDILL